MYKDKTVKYNVFAYTENSVDGSQMNTVEADLLKM